MSTDNNLQVYLKLNELRQGQGNTKEVHDFSKNEYHGAVQGQPTPTADDRFGSCLNLGKEDSIKIDKSSQNKGINLLVGQTDSFTLGFWFKPAVEETKGDTAIVLSVSSTVKAEQQSLTIVQKTLASEESTSLDKFGLQLEINGKDVIDATSSGRIKHSEWNYIAIAIDRKAEEQPKIEIYLNEVGMNLNADNSILNSLSLKDCVIEIAPQSGQQKFAGQVAHLRVYNELLPLAELQKEIQDDETATSAFNKSHPIEFDLHNENDEHILYISDKEEQSLILEITNTSAEDIEFQFLKSGESWQDWKANEERYHFQLSFRPGTLSDFSTKMLQSPETRLLGLSQGWDCVYDPDDHNLVDWISFLWVGEEGRQLVKEIADKAASTQTQLKGLFDEISAQITQLKDPSELLASLQELQKNQGDLEGPSIRKKGIRIVELGGLGAAVGGGARGTRVHLKYDRLGYSRSNPNSDATQVPSGTRSQFLNIINRQGKVNIPLHVGFVGSNTVLNDGKTSNELTLRITNLQKEPLSLEGGSGSPQFRIYFDFEDRSTANGNGQQTAAELQKVTELQQQSLQTVLSQIKTIASRVNELAEPSPQSANDQQQRSSIIRDQIENAVTQMETLKEQSPSRTDQKQQVSNADVDRVIKIASDVKNVTNESLQLNDQKRQILANVIQKIEEIVSQMNNLATQFSSMCREKEQWYSEVFSQNDSLISHFNELQETHRSSYRELTVFQEDLRKFKNEDSTLSIEKQKWLREAIEKSREMLDFTRNIERVPLQFNEQKKQNFEEMFDCFRKVERGIGDLSEQFLEMHNQKQHHYLEYLKERAVELRECSLIQYSQIPYASSIYAHVEECISTKIPELEQRILRLDTLRLPSLREEINKALVMKSEVSGLIERSLEFDRRKQQQLSQAIDEISKIESQVEDLISQAAPLDDWKDDWKQEWSIASLTNAQKISVVGRDPDDQEAWKIMPQDLQTPNPHWLLEPKHQKFAPKESFEFVIQNLISDAPDGFASLYVEYKNIPGYWDGRIICPIEKSPLVYRQKAVGIGTDSPKAKLHISVEQENSVAGSTQQRHAAIFVGGNVGIGATPKASLHVKNKHNDVTKPAAVFEGGNVGIGMTNPTTQLQIKGTVTATAFVGHGAVVAGMIVMWSGKETEIPPGWKLCDGNDGTPDLRSRFLVGAGKGRAENRPNTLYEPSDKGNADTHTHSIQTPQSLQTSHGGGHAHRMPSLWYGSLACASLDKTVLGGQQPTVTIVDRRGTTVESSETQDSGGHSHQVNISSESFSSGSYSGENRPRWYALCFIMYVGS